MTLRPYQEEILAAIQREFDAGIRRTIVAAATGSGKTIVFAKLAERHIDGKVLVLVNREELLQQALEKIRFATGMYCGVERAGDSTSLATECVVASIQTMVRRIAKYPRDHFGLVVVDECHYSMSDQWQTVLNHFDGHARVVGFSATPFRADGKKLDEYYETTAYTVGVFDLVKAGYLSPISVQTIPIVIGLDGIRTKAGDFSEEDLDDRISPFFRDVARAIKEHAAGRKTLAFLPLIRSSQKFVGICMEEGVRAAHIDGGSDDRKELLLQFRRGDFELLANSNLLTTGYDEPGISCIVNLRPTKSTALFQQICGRGTRLAPQKRDLLLLDFLWEYGKHGLASPAHLIANSQEEAEEITKALRKKKTPEQLEDIAVEIQKQKERQILEAARRAQETQKRLGQRLGSIVDAELFAALIEDVKLLNYEPSTAREAGRMTEKQCDFLRREGIDVSTVKGFGHASALISHLIDRKNKGLVSVKSLGALQARGIERPQETTQSQARALYGEKLWKLGKYRDQPLSAAPRSYCRWALETLFSKQALQRKYPDEYAHCQAIAGSGVAPRANGNYR